MSEFVPIMGMFTFFGSIVVVIAFLIVYNHKRRQLQSQEIMAAIEKGVDVPFPALKAKKWNYLNLGLICSLVGVTFTLALWFSTGLMAATAWGLLPIGLGVAFLLIALIERNKKEDEDESD